MFAKTNTPRPWADENGSFLGAFGWTPGMVLLRLDRRCGGIAYYGDFAWTRRHRHASRTTSQPILLPSRFKLVLRRSRDGWKKKYAELKVECKRLKQRSPMFAVPVPAGEARPKRPVERPRSFGPRTPGSRLNSTHWQTGLKKKVADLPALVDDPSFGEIPATHGYPCGIIALFLGLVQLGVSFRATSRVLDFIARFFDLPFSAPDWTTGRLWLLWLAWRNSACPRSKPTIGSG